MGPEIPTDCAVINTSKNTDSSYKESAKVADIVKISVDTTEDDNITDNKEAANVAAITQTLVKFKNWLSPPPNDNDNISVDKVIDSSNNIKEVLAFSKDSFGPEITVESDMNDDKKGPQLHGEEYLRLTIQSTMNNKSLAANIVDNRQQPSSKSKDLNNTFVDKVLEGGFNNDEVIDLTQEDFETEVTEEVDILNDEKVTKVAVNKNLRITTQSKLQLTVKDTSTVDKYDSGALKWFSNNTPVNYTTNLEVASTSSSLNTDKINYDCKLQSSKHETKNKKESISISTSANIERIRVKV